MEVAKRPFYKKWWFWSIIAVFVINAAVHDNKDRPVVAKELPAVQAIQEKQEPDKQGTKEVWKVTASEFGAIQTGMTYRQVVEAAGMLGQMLSEAGEKGTAAHTMIFKFDGEGSPGANAVVTFQGGKVIAKAQYGLE